jgi:alpha-N-arabinofuranosidase
MKAMITRVVLLMTLLTGPAWCQADFDDGFDGATLNPRWEWFVPKAGPTYSLKDAPGSLRITLPQSKDGFNHWNAGGADKAPLLLTAAPQGDFTVETHLRVVSHGPDSNFHLGLIVGFSRRFVLAWGPFYAPSLGNPKDKPEIWCEPTGQPRYLVDRGDARDVFLRITKTGRSYAMSLRRSEQAPWVSLGSWESIWPARYLGFMGKTFGDGPAVIADLDYLKVESKPTVQSPAPTATVQVDCSKPTWPLDPMRYGHFIEHLGRCIDGGLWAEVLTNRKFTGKVGAEGVVESWQPLAASPGVSYSRDNVEYYCPSQSQRITATAADSKFGITQAKLKLRGGVAYKVRLVARQEGLTKPVNLGFLSDGKPLSPLQSITVQPGWQAYEVTLAPLPAETEASFAITGEGAGKLWLGAVSLMPADNVDGFRADVLQAIREIKPPVLRWPGGNFVSQYDWRDGLGERDRRPPRWNRAWNQWEWNDMGTDEFLRLCQLVDTEPYICVNCGEGQATEAAAWVEYCNGSAQSGWGKVRAANGHPQPYGITIWGVGNEMWGDWQHGHLNATNYGIKSVEFARAMRAVDPSIKLIGDGVQTEAYNGWNREACRIAGQTYDWLSVHHYAEIPAATDTVLAYSLALTTPVSIERMLADTFQIARDASGKDLPLAFDEWNITHGGAPYSLRDGLYACGVFNALNRLGPKVPMANLALLINVLGATQVTPTATVRTPTHQAFDLYTNHSGTLGLPVAVDAPSYSFAGSANLTALDAVASLSADRRTLYIAVLNRLPGDEVRGTLKLSGFAAADSVKVITLNGQTPETANTPEAPDRVRLQSRTISLQEAASYTFPAHSATVLEFQARAE